MNPNKKAAYRNRKPTEINLFEFNLVGFTIQWAKASSCTANSFRKSFCLLIKIKCNRQHVCERLRPPDFLKPGKLDNQKKHAKSIALLILNAFLITLERL